MKRHFIYITIVLLALLNGFTGCKKDKDAIPAVSTGSISGTISPKAAAVSIEATNLQSNKAYSVKVDTTTGIFKITGIDTGAYKISFTAAANSITPADINTAVTAGKNSDMGTIVFESSSIMGTISPAAAVSYIYMTRINGTPYDVALDTATGLFKTGTLPAGDYYLTFSAAHGFQSPWITPVIVTVATGQSSNMGTIVMFPHTLFGIPNNLFVTSAFGATYSSPDFTITSGYSDKDNGSSRSFKIVMDNITAPGTYNCINTATSAITNSTRSSYFSLPLLWTTIDAGGSGTVVVTSIDTAKKEIIGTFKAILVNSSNPNEVINNSSFDFVYQ